MLFLDDSTVSLLRIIWIDGLRLFLQKLTLALIFSYIKAESKNFKSVNTKKVQELRYSFFLSFRYKRMNCNLITVNLLRNLKTQ